MNKTKRGEYLCVQNTVRQWNTSSSSSSSLHSPQCFKLNILHIKNPKKLVVVGIFVEYADKDSKHFLKKAGERFQNASRVIVPIKDILLNLLKVEKKN